MDAKTDQVHVVRVSMSRTWTVEAAHCDTLPPDVVDEIRGLGAGWRKPQNAVAKLDELRRRLALGGLVIWYAVKSKLPDVPQAITVPFEPLELDQARAPLADLCGTSVGEAVVARRRWGRGIFRYGIPIVALTQIPNAIAQIAIHRSLFVIVLWGLIFAFTAAVFFLVWWLADQWLLVPGGVVIRKTFFGKVGESLQLYTPADSVVIVRPQPPGSATNIELWRDGKVRRRRATLLEAMALVAAWQSPIAPPPLSRMGDLAG